MDICEEAKKKQLSEAHRGARRFIGAREFLFTFIQFSLSLDLFTIFRNDHRILTCLLPMAFRLNATYLEPWLARFCATPCPLRFEQHTRRDRNLRLVFAPTSVVLLWPETSSLLIFQSLVIFSFNWYTCWILFKNKHSPFGAGDSKLLDNLYHSTCGCGEPSALHSIASSWLMPTSISSSGVLVHFISTFFVFFFVAKKSY